MRRREHIWRRPFKLLLTGMLAATLGVTSVLGDDTAPQAVIERLHGTLLEVMQAADELGYQGRYDRLPVNTSVSVLCRLFAGQRRSAEPVRRGLKAIVEHLPRWTKGDGHGVNFYYWYYGTYAVFQAVGDATTDKRWSAWNEAMLGALLPNQRTDGCARGSWDPQGEWCLGAGRVYGVAINALTLQSYYRFQRIADGQVAKLERGR